MTILVYIIYHVIKWTSLGPKEGDRLPSPQHPWVRIISLGFLNPERYGCLLGLVNSTSWTFCRLPHKNHTYGSVFLFVTLVSYLFVPFAFWTFKKRAAVQLSIDAVLLARRSKPHWWLAALLQQINCKLSNCVGLLSNISDTPSPYDFAWRISTDIAYIILIYFTSIIFVDFSMLQLKGESMCPLLPPSGYADAEINRFWCNNVRFQTSKN